MWQPLAKSGLEDNKRDWVFIVTQRKRGGGRPRRGCGKGIEASLETYPNFLNYLSFLKWREGRIFFFCTVFSSLIYIIFFFLFLWSVANFRRANQAWHMFSYLQDWYIFKATLATHTRTHAHIQTHARIHTKQQLVPVHEELLSLGVSWHLATLED